MWSHIDKEFNRRYNMVIPTNTVTNAKIKTKLSQKYEENEVESMEQDLEKRYATMFHTEILHLAKTL